MDSVSCTVHSVVSNVKWKVYNLKRIECIVKCTGLSVGESYGFYWNGLKLKICVSVCLKINRPEWLKSMFVNGLKKSKDNFFFKEIPSINILNMGNILSFITQLQW